MSALRCHVTGNLCGTDTLPKGFLCACASCAAFAELESLRAQLAEAQRERERLREFMAAFDAWRAASLLGGEAECDAMLEKRAAVGE